MRTLLGAVCDWSPPTGQCGWAPYRRASEATYSATHRDTQAKKMLIELVYTWELSDPRAKKRLVYIYRKPGFEPVQPPSPRAHRSLNHGPPYVRAEAASRYVATV